VAGDNGCLKQHMGLLGLMVVILGLTLGGFCYWVKTGQETVAAQEGRIRALEQGAATSTERLSAIQATVNEIRQDVKDLKTRRAGG